LHPAKSAKEKSWALNEQRESSTDDATASSGSTCDVTEHWVGEVAVVAVAGVIDAVTAPQFDEALRAAVANKPEGLVVDLTAVEFLASAGMGVLVAAHDDADDGTRFSVVADGPATSRPLKLVGIADIVPLYATLDDALAALRS
jgi:anti-sigma B factor antagonist